MESESDFLGDQLSLKSVKTSKSKQTHLSLEEEEDFVSHLPVTKRNSDENYSRAKMVVRAALKKDTIDTISEFNRVVNLFVKMYAYNTAVRGVSVCLKSLCSSDLGINVRILNQRLKKYKTFGRNYLSEVEYVRLASVAILGIIGNSSQTYYYYNFLICAIWGLRVSDSTALIKQDFENIKANGKTVYITQKTKASIILKMHPLVDLLLEKWNNRLPTSDRDLYHTFAKHYASTFGIKKPNGIGFHSLRFRYAEQRDLAPEEICTIELKRRDYNGTCLYDMILPLKTDNVQAILGHKNIEQTQHYAKTAEIRDIVQREIQQGTREEDSGFLQ